MTRFGLEENLDFFDILLEHYSEKRRAYHNKTHIADCLEKFDEVESHLSYPHEVELAIWFHDVIYNPYKGDNELQSAIRCESFMNDNGVQEEIIKRVYDLIMATKHPCVPQNKDEEYLIDIDISILGASTEEYTAYARKIRKEYSFVPWFYYKKKRKEVLQAFLDQNTLYHTEYFKDKFEEQAIENLKNEIIDLGGKV